MSVKIEGKIRCVADLRWLEEQLGFAKDAFLRKRGWTHSSSHPGSLWLWSKTINGVAYHGVSRSTALHMEDWADGVACRCDEDGDMTDCAVHRFEGNEG
jgi:hypothetical protein